MSEEEAINRLNDVIDDCRDWLDDEYVADEDKEWKDLEKRAIETILSAYEKEKETSHYIQSQLDIANAKLIEEKENIYGLEEEIQAQAKNLMVYEDEIVSINKMWEDKIKAKIEEVNYKMVAHPDVRGAVIDTLQDLLEGR